MEYSNEFIYEFYNCVIEGSVVPFRNLNKEYRLRRREVKDSKQEYYGIVDDYNKKFDQIIKDSIKILSDSIKVNTTIFERSVKELKKSSPDFSVYINSLMPVIFTKCYIEVETEENYFNCNNPAQKIIHHNLHTFPNTNEHKLGQCHDYNNQH